VQHRAALKARAARAGRRLGMDSNIHDDTSTVRPVPPFFDDGRENFQTALHHLSTVHSLEVGALQRENTWLKVQVGQLQSSLKKLQFIGEPGIRFVTDEACVPEPPWPVHGPQRGEDDWAALGDVAEDPEPDLPRQLPQVHEGTLQDLQSMAPLASPDLRRDPQVLNMAEKAVDQGAAPDRDTRGARASQSGSRIMRAEDAPEKVFEMVRDIELTAARYQPDAKRRGAWRSRRLRCTHISGQGEQGTVRQRVSRVVETNYFDFTCGVVIILNSVLIGWSVEHKTLHPTEEIFFIEVAGHVCSFFFLVELLLRMYVQGNYYFNADNRPWNYFDIILVVYSIVDAIMMVLVRDQNSSGLHSNMKTIKMFRILRVFRVFRFFRELSLLALMIVDSIRSLIWALIMLTVIIYVFAICFTQSAAEYINEHGDAGDPGVARWFGSLFRTVYSLVVSMLGGVSWHEVSDPLLLVHWSQAALFFFYITFTILAVLNIITGVFVDNAVETAGMQREFLVQKEMEIKEKYVKEMREFFIEMDQDGSGTVTLEEVKEYFDDLRVQSYFQALGIDPQDTERLFHLIDDDGSGEISVDEFLDGCLRLKGSARSIDVHALMYECKRLENRQLLMLRMLGAEPPGKLNKMQSGSQVCGSLHDERHSLWLCPRWTAANFCTDSAEGESPMRRKAEATTGTPLKTAGDGRSSSMGIGPAEIGVELARADQRIDADRQAVNTSSTSTAGQGTDQTNSPPDSSGARSSPGREASYKEDFQDEEDFMSW